MGSYNSGDLSANTFALGPHNEGIPGYEQVTFHQLDNGLWEAFKEFYESQDGISTHHDYYSKYCSICLKNNYRLKISGKNQTCGSKSSCYDELADIAKWVHDKSSYCKYA